MKKQLKTAIDDWIRENPGYNTSYSQPSGSWILEYNRQFYVSVEESAYRQELYFYSVIGQSTEKTHEGFALEALKGNLFGRETGYSSIGYDDATQSFILFRRLSYEHLTAQSFADAMNEFLAYRIYWEKKFTDPAQTISQQNQKKEKGKKASSLSIYYG